MGLVKNSDIIFDSTRMENVGGQKKAPCPATTSR
jgi:hypothetical protein